MRECQEVHARRGRPSASTGYSNGSSASTAIELPRKSLANDDTDLDLDFFTDYTTSSTLANGGFPAANNPSVMLGSDGQQTGSDNLAILQPHHRAILQHLPSTSAMPSLPIATQATLPVHQNAISRALVRTIGRLGRWKRVLNSRSHVSVPHGTVDDVSAFDLELNATGDLLTVRGGVEQYLKMIEVKPTSLPTSQPPSGPSSVTGQIITLPPVEVVTPPPHPPPLPSPIEESVEEPNDLLVEEAVTVEADDAQPLGDIAEGSDESADTNGVVPPQPDSADSEQVHVSFRPSAPARRSTSSSGSSDYGEPISPGRSEQPIFAERNGQQQGWSMDIASIDDLDQLSDSSSEHEPTAPPGFMKPTRRLPLRRAFEFVHGNRDSVSSRALTSHESIMSGPTSSVASDASTNGGLGNTIQQWQVNAIVDSLTDDEEMGDVEDALRRLEGQMNPQERRAKESKVDNWIKTIRNRMDTGDHTDEAPRFSLEGSPETEADEVSLTDGDGSASVAESSSSAHSDQSSASDARSTMEGVTPTSTRLMKAAPVHTVSSVDAKPLVEDVVPIEILRSRVPTSPSLSAKSASIAVPTVLHLPSTKFASSQPRLHRSFVLGFGASELAQHFSMIDRELFLGVKFEELTSDNWVGGYNEADILDWGQFLKDRARWKAEGRGGYKTSALIAARGRFNLIANFVLSEVVLTHPAERPALVGKFIRIAWVRHELSHT